MKKPENLLIIRTDRIGDVILSLPLAAEVKKKYPGCKVTFLVREYTRSLVAGNRNIDEIMLLKMSGSKILISDNIRELRKRNFDSALMVYPTFLLSMIVFFSGIRIRIGTGYRWYSFLFNLKVYEHRKYALKHELEYNLSLLSVLGVESTGGIGKVDFSLKLSDENRERASAILAENGVKAGKRMIIIHPGSGGSAVDLPAAKFRELIGLISAGTDCEIILTGSGEEWSKCSDLMVNKRVKNLAGKFDLAELVEVIGMSSVFISNSTGPLHIAAALNKYVIGFYPKVQVCSARRWGPYNEAGFVFVPEIDCTNCTVEQCIKLDCMSSISMNKVFEKIEKILKLLPNTGESNVS